jgi:hypothetical protein
MVDELATAGSELMVRLWGGAMGEIRIMQAYADWWGYYVF